MSATRDADTVLTENVQPGGAGNAAGGSVGVGVSPRGGGGGGGGTTNKPSSKPLSVFAALFGECMCADSFRVRPSDLRLRSSATDGASQSSAPFLVLDGIEVISLGSIEKPGGHSPGERVRETAAQLATDATRLVSVGYLVEDERGILRGGESEREADSGNNDGNRAVGWAESQSQSSVSTAGVVAADGCTPRQQQQQQASSSSSPPPQSQPAAVRSELVSLEIYEETYPGDLERSLNRASREALTGIRTRNFDSAYRGFEKLASEHKKKGGTGRTTKRRGATKAPPGGIGGTMNESAYLAGIHVQNMAVCRLLAGAAATEGVDAAGASAAEEEALVLFLEAAELKRSSFGPSHPEVADTLVEIGIRRYAADDTDGAFEALNEARRIFSSSLRSDHPKVASVLNNKGCVHFQSSGGGNVAALTCFQEARDIQQRAMETGGAGMGGMGRGMRGELDLLHVATTLCNVGYMKFRMKNYEEAGAIFEDTLLVQQSVLGDNHQTIKDTLSNIALANAFHS